tara:strand:+ start:16076 stop:16864 length:789 start_codon:yes stop_codon:yes gene_type:complete
MKRHLKTLRTFWSTAIASQLEYQLNFIIEILAMIGTLTGSIFTLSLFFNQGQSLGGWTWKEALIIQGVYTFLDGITNTWLRPNLTEIVNYIREGTLDFVLLKPINSQFWVSFRTLSPSGLPEIFLGFTVIIWSLVNIGKSISYSNILFFITMLLASVFILYSVWFLIAATSIWFVKTWNATEVLRALLASGRYPISAFPSTLRFVFIFIIPIGFLTTVPSEIILGKSGAIMVYLGIFVAFIFFTLSKVFWDFALSHYTSASS